MVEYYLFVFSMAFKVSSQNEILYISNDRKISEAIF